NRVKDAQSVYRKLKEDAASNFKVFLYHSRFIYKDRFKRHREVIDAFKDSVLPVILVATQVAEMSLDLSADLLITQLANVPALIQRLGRLNRRYCGKPQLAIFCPDNLPNYPYSHEELEESKRFANTFNVCSQDDLKEYLKRVNTSGRVSTEFERGYYLNIPTPLRKEGYTINCFLKQHLEEVRKLSRLKSHMFLIPMLVNTKNEVAKHNKIPVYSALYSHEFGAE
ncbi:CRISPR-associated helicase Cas3', partial [Cylindrospermopsis raciborskii]|uniref:CRISPR-associated helicase Cas3' n=1 Tax=Cylindrospermopsis raciborskii TaxID=77022 RepID=UPI0022CB3654